MVPNPETREVVARLLASQQQVIDLKAQIDREHQASLGLRRFGERAFQAENLETFLGIAAEEIVNTFGVENSLILRFGPEGATICASCCVDGATFQDAQAFERVIHEVHGRHARVFNEGSLPPLLGRPTAVLLAGTFTDKSDKWGIYGVVATISKDKAPFYPKFGNDFAPLFGAFLNHIGVLQQHLRAREAEIIMMRAMQHFVPREFLQALGHNDVTTARLGDSALRHLTILFADIRNFTAISEGMQPAETAAFLNSCLSRIGPHIRANNGFVDKYIGDAILALFPGSPSDAVRAGLAMQAEIQSTNNANPDAIPIALGIGIHAGEVMMCTIGEAERFEVTVISDAVNLTSRLESLTKQLGCTMLASAEIVKQLSPEELSLSRPLGSFAVKGKMESVGIIEIFAADQPYLREKKIATRKEFGQALDLYHQGLFSEALSITRRLVQEAPEDGPLTWWLTQMHRAAL